MRRCEALQFGGVPSRGASVASVHQIQRVPIVGFSGLMVLWRGIGQWRVQTKQKHWLPRDLHSFTTTPRISLTTTQYLCRGIFTERTRKGGLMDQL